MSDMPAQVATGVPTRKTVAPLLGHVCIRLCKRQICLDALDGLRFCHEGCGGVFTGDNAVLLHLDINPANILLRREHSCGQLEAALGMCTMACEQPMHAPPYLRRTHAQRAHTPLHFPR